MSDMIMDALEGSPSGKIPIGDKSSPADIAAYVHGVSKKDFKNAVGRLYRSGKILPGKEETTLIPEEMRTEKFFEEHRISKRNAEIRKAEPQAPQHSDNIYVTGENKAGKLAKLLSPSNTGATPFQRRDESKTIFVGNLPFTVNEKILENTVSKVLGSNKVNQYIVVISISVNNY